MRSRRLLDRGRRPLKLTVRRGMPISTRVLLGSFYLAVMAAIVAAFFHRPYVSARFLSDGSLIALALFASATLCLLAVIFAHSKPLTLVAMAVSIFYALSGLVLVAAFLRAVLLRHSGFDVDDPFRMLLFLVPLLATFAFYRGYLGAASNNRWNGP